MNKVYPWPKKQDKRQVYYTSLEMTRINESFELIETVYGHSTGQCTLWQGSIEHPILGIMLIDSSDGKYPCNMIRVVYKCRSYVYSEAKWYTYEERHRLIEIAVEFAQALLADTYSGDEYQLNNQEFPNE